MPQETYERIISDLALIDYAQVIYFHLYNEPLAAPEVLLSRMRYARDRLPRAIFSLNTNGDYLTTALLADLDAAGCNSIFVSIYGPDHGRWDDAYIQKRVRRAAELLGVKGKLTERPGSEYAVAGKVGTVELRIAGRNLWATGYDRGGLVPELRVTRSSPCLAPFTEFLVDHRGYALPCCNVYTDRSDHLQYTVGNMSAVDLDIFSVYAGMRLRAWRKGLLAFDPGGELCSGCSRGNHPELDTPANRDALTQLRAHLALPE
jgi:MoaA/NifB/PqqE/SkfB family radical SAM enzyme